jgi:hypothetical protein
LARSIRKEKNAFRHFILSVWLSIAFEGVPYQTTFTPVRTSSRFCVGATHTRRHPHALRAGRAGTCIVAPG